MKRSLWPVCGKCCEVSYFDWMGGPHYCVQVDESDDEVHECAECAEPASRRVIIDGADLEYFRAILTHGLSGQLGDIREVRLVVERESMLIGANGRCSENFGRVVSG